ncbi:hypothetical protein JCM17823_21810 [Halorubrum gandharaense]
MLSSVTGATLSRATTVMAGRALGGGLKGPNGAGTDYRSRAFARCDYRSRAPTRPVRLPVEGVLQKRKLMPDGGLEILAVH